MEKLFQNNTYGICSINHRTFNQDHNGSVTYPKQARDYIITVLKAHNFLLLIGGYTKFKRITGSVRMLTGAVILMAPLAVGKRKRSESEEVTKGLIVGKFYDEALVTGAAQMMRGVLEAYVPHGRIVNIALDAVATIPNLILSDIDSSSEYDIKDGLNIGSCYKVEPDSDGLKPTNTRQVFSSPHTKPHEDPQYSSLWWILNFV